MDNIQFDMNVFDFIAQGASSFSSLVALIGIFAAMFIVSVFVTKLGDIILPKPKETRVSDFLPFSRLDEDGATIHFRNGSLARVFEITGADTTLLTASERFALMGARKQWVDAMASLEVVSRVITIRERVVLGEEGEHKDSKLLKQVSQKWMENMSRVFRNKHYIIISVNDRKTAMDDLKQATNALTSILDMYQPVLISEKTPSNSAFIPVSKSFSKDESKNNSFFVSKAEDFFLT
jgi:type IV secretory pathway VirB4 component